MLVSFPMTDPDSGRCPLGLKCVGGRHDHAWSYTVPTQRLSLSRFLMVRHYLCVYALVILLELGSGWRVTASVCVCVWGSWWEPGAGDLSGYWTFISHALCGCRRTTTGSFSGLCVMVEKHLLLDLFVFFLNVCTSCDFVLEMDQALINV